MKEKLNIWSKKVVKKTDIAQKLIDQYEKRKDDQEIAFAKLSLCRLWDRVRQKKLQDSEITNTNTIVETSNESIHFDAFDIEKIFASEARIIRL